MPLPHWVSDGGATPQGDDEPCLMHNRLLHGDQPWMQATRALQIQHEAANVLNQSVGLRVGTGNVKCSN